MAKFVRILWVPVLLSMLYTGWVFWRRHTAEPSSPASDPDPMAAYGTSVRILQFYTASPQIAMGGKALVCYAVVNAKEVRIDPPIEEVWPAVSRCFDVTPSKSTRYTLTAQGADNTTVSKTMAIEVTPNPR